MTRYRINSADREGFGPPGARWASFEADSPMAAVLYAQSHQWENARLFWLQAFENGAWRYVQSP